MNDNTKQAYKSLENTKEHLINIYYYLPYLDNEQYAQLHKLEQDVNEFRKNSLTKINAPLIALKQYTEGKVSWERAGLISDLHIFGLREYCKDRDVNWGLLRYDEYYGVYGEEGINKIKENWEKLDPEHEFYPINFEGDSFIKKHNMFINKTKIGTNIEISKDNYLVKQAQMLIAQYQYFYNTSWDTLIKNQPEFEETYRYNYSSQDNKFLQKLSDGLHIYNINELKYLKHILHISYNLSDEAIEDNNYKKLHEAIINIKDVINESYCFFSIKKDKVEKYIKSLEDM